MRKWEAGRTVGDNLSSNGGVDAGHLEVGADVGVVEVDLVAAAQVLDAIVVNLGASLAAAHQHRGADQAGGHELLDVLLCEREKFGKRWEEAGG